MHDDHARPIDRQRRKLLATALDLAAAGAVLGVPSGAFAQRGGVAGSVAGLAPLPLTGTRLVLLGTRGGPGVDPTQAQTASAVVVDGTPYLVDCGYGAVRALVASGIGFQPVGKVFFTHLHDDHTTDLPTLLSLQWTASRSQPTDAYGPHGTAALVTAALQFLRANAEIRMVDEGRTTPPDELFRGHDVPARAEPLEVFADDRVRVTAVENTHFPERFKARMPYRAISLRFDTRERSIVFSGDTAYSENLVTLARDADVLVCEVMDHAVHAQMLERASAAAAAGNAESIFRHVAETHVTPADIARMATAAKVKTVVLNHQLPGPSAGPLGFPVSAFIDGVSAGFGGQVIVGRDLMVL
jgi:ribonuclease BN (tRNA processing enzyme)